MSRLLLSALVALCAAACATDSMSIKSGSSSMSPELAVLDRMIGTWNGTAEFVSPTPQEMQAIMKEQMPDFEGEFPTSFKGGSKNRWVLNGNFLENEGWHEEGPGVKVYYKEYITWDANAGKYRSSYFGDNGDTGEGWWTFDAGTNTFHATWKGTNKGQPMTGSGTMTFTDANTMTWDYQSDGPDGHMEMKGVSRRS